MSLALLIAAQLSCPAPTLMAQAAPPAVTNTVANPAAPPDNTPRNQAFSLALNRANNLARATAERLNGGLGRYAAERRMFGLEGRTEYTYKDGFFTFQFVGGPPGWQPQGLPPTIESVISVSFDGQTIRTDYNGPIRSGTSAPLQQNCTCPPVQIIRPTR